MTVRNIRTAIVLSATLAIGETPALAGLMFCDFAPPVKYAADHPTAVAVGDFNGDGKLDLAVTLFEIAPTHHVSIRLGNGDGTFSQPVNYNIGGGEPTSIAVGDFNRDGNLDLVVSNNNTNNVAILLGNGDGTFASGVTFAAGNGPSSVAVGDFNGDGIPDLAVANNRSNDVSILLGNGDGSFRAVFVYAVASNPQAVAVGDFNRDGKLDLAVASFAAVSVLLGRGDGTFLTPTNYVADSGPVSVAVGDFNGDGAPDLAVANIDSGDVSVLLGTGDGTFRAPANYRTGGNPTTVAIADFDHDGRVDLAVGSFDSNIVILAVRDDGTSDSQALPNTSGTRALAAADFDGNGSPDLVAADNAAPNFMYVSVLLNECQSLAVPSLSGVVLLLLAIVLAGVGITRT